jgi:hypothetical protein
MTSDFQIQAALQKWGYASIPAEQHFPESEARKHGWKLIRGSMFDVMFTADYTAKIRDSVELLRNYKPCPPSKSSALSADAGSLSSTNPDITTGTGVCDAPAPASEIWDLEYE